MKIHAQKQMQPQQKAPLHPSRITRHKIENQSAQALPRMNAEGHKVCSDASATTRFDHDFSRIPLHSKAPVRLQPKLAVSTPSDIYEQEADRVSEQVMNLHPPKLQRTCACPGGCPKCKNEHTTHKQMQTKPVQANETEETATPPIVNEVLQSSGQPLDTSTREFMESRFNHDFSRVRVHTDPAAAESADAIGALAYTVGQDIFFGTQHHLPASVSGKRLIAHELTHTIQQRSVPQHRMQLQVSNQSHKGDTKDEKDMIPIILDDGKIIRLFIDTATPQVFKLKYGLFSQRFAFTSVKKYSKKVTRMFGADINPNSMSLFKLGYCLSLYNPSEDYVKLIEPFQGVPINTILIKAMEQNPRFGMDIVGNVSIAGMLNEKGEVISPFGFKDWDPNDFLGFTEARAKTVKKMLFGDRANVQTFGIMEVVEVNPATGKLKNMKGYETTRPPNKDAMGVTIFLRIRDGVKHGVRNF